MIAGSSADITGFKEVEVECSASSLPSGASRLRLLRGLSGFERLSPIDVLRRWLVNVNARWARPV
jgi:hypothetical protein